MTAVTIDLEAFKRKLASGPLSLTEFRKAVGKEFSRTRNMAAEWGQGGPTHKRKFANGRPRRQLPDGRILHHTKGFALSDRGGYCKRSRRSNRTCSHA